MERYEGDLDGNKGKYRKESEDQKGETDLCASIRNSLESKMQS